MATLLLPAGAPTLLCRRCGLYKHVQSPFIFFRGRGNQVHPDLVFVGEAPGAEEDREGRPWVGPAGRLLQEALDNFPDLLSYVLMNVVRCRPPGNDLTKWPAALETCVKHACASIKTFRPRGVVLLGKVPMKAMLGIDGPITQLRGSLHYSAEGWFIVPTMHPSYILRLGGLKACHPHVNAFMGDLHVAVKKSKEVEKAEQEVVNMSEAIKRESEAKRKLGKVVGPAVVDMHAMRRQL